MAKRLYKSRSDRMLSGVSGGIAEYFDVDPTIVRAVWLIGSFATAGVGVVVYVALAIIVPEPVADSTARSADASEVRDSEDPAPYEAGEPAESRDERRRAGRRRHRREGSIIGGAILIVLGVLFLASNFDLLYWFDWRFWPVFLILFGALLVVRRMNERDRHG